MSTAVHRLSSVLDLDVEDASLSRSLLSEQAAEKLRRYISIGRIPEGTKITEREVSALLGISRAPARDALKILESQGLVIAKPGGRFVTILTEQDVRDLHELRSALETLAIRLAASRVTDADRQRMAEGMAELERATGDSNEWARCDLALHHSIWQASGNQYLIRILGSVLGPVIVLADRDKAQRQRDVAADLRDHHALVDLVSAGDAQGAVEEIRRHLDRSLSFSLQTFRLREHAQQDAE